MSPTSNKNSNDSFSVEKIEWARRLAGALSKAWFSKVRRPWTDSGSGVGILVAALFGLALATCAVFALIFPFILSQSEPELLDLHRSDDYRGHSITTGAVSQDEEKLFVGSAGNGLTVIEPDIFRIRNERTGDLSGPSSNNLSDLAVAPDGSLLALTNAMGQGVDLRTSDGEWRPLIAADGIPGIKADNVIMVTASKGTLVLLLNDGRLAVYTQASRSLTAMEVAGEIPGRITSATLDLTAETESWRLWLAAGKKLIRVEAQENIAVATPVKLPNGEAVIDVASTKHGLFARMEKGSLYLRTERWKRLLGGEQWPGLSLNNVRFAGVSADKSTLWLIPHSSASSTFDVGAYFFDEQRWACGNLPKGVVTNYCRAMPRVSPDGRHLIVPRKSTGISVMGHSGDSIDETLKNTLKGERVVHTHDDGRHVVFTTSSALDNTRRVRLVAWSALTRNEKASGALLREGSPTRLDDTNIVDVLTYADSLLFLENDYTLIPYDLKLRGFGAPWHLMTEKGEAPSGRLVGAVKDKNKLWIVGENGSVLQYSLGLFKNGVSNVNGQRVFSPGPIPLDSEIACALALSDGFDLILESGDAWNYSFNRGWSQVGAGLVPKDVLRLADQQAICRTIQGQLVVRFLKYWGAVTPPTEKTILSKLYPGQKRPIAKLGDGSWGYLDYAPSTNRWRIETLIAAIPREGNRPSHGVTAAIANSDDSCLIAGDSNGLVLYHFASHRWERLLKSESIARWIFEKLDQNLFALDRGSHSLYSVSLRPPHSVRQVAGEFLSIAVTEKTGLGLRTNGTLRWLEGDRSRSLPMRLSADQALSSHDSPLSGAAQGDAVAVVSRSGELFRYSFKEGIVRKVGGPWEKTKPPKVLVEICATPDYVAVRTRDGLAYSATGLGGPYNRVNNSENIKIKSLGALGPGITLLNETGGVEYIADGTSTPAILAGGARPERTPGDLTAVLIEGDEITLGGKQGLAVRPPKSRYLVKRRDAKIGAVDRFELFDGQVFAWTDKGLFARDDDRIFRNIAPQGFNQLARLEYGEKNTLFSLDQTGAAHVVALGEKPEKIGVFGSTTVSSQPIQLAADIGKGRFLLALQDGTLQVYLENERKIVTTRDPNNRTVVYLGCLSDKDVCVISKDESSVWFEKLRLRPNGEIEVPLSKFEDVHQWILKDPSVWTRAADNLSLLTTDYEFVTIKESGLSGSKLNSASKTDPVDIARIFPTKNQILLLDKNGELHYYRPSTWRAIQHTGEVGDLWPLGSDDFVKIMQSGDVRAAKSFASIKKTSHEVRGDGTAVAFSEKDSKGRELHVLREGNEQESVSLSGAVTGPDHMKALWSATEGDRIHALDVNGRKVFKYDARKASWENYLETKDPFSTFIGRGEHPVLLFAPTRVHELGTGKEAVLPEGIAPIASEDGRAFYVDNYGALHEADHLSSKTLFKPTRVIAKDQTSLHWAVELDGCLVLGLDSTVLEWRADEDRPKELANTTPLPPGEKTWIAPEETCSTIWCWHNETRTLFEVSQHGVERLSDEALQPIGVTSGSLVCQTEGQDLKIAESGTGLQALLTKPSSGQTPAGGSAYRIKQDGLGEPWLGVDKENNLITRPSSLPGVRWTRTHVGGWQTLRSVKYRNKSVVIQGLDFESRERIMVGRLSHSDFAIDHSILWDKRGLRNLTKGDRLIDREAFEALGDRNKWIQDRASGDLLCVDSDSGALTGRLTLDKTLKLDRLPEIRRIRQESDGQVWVNLNGSWLPYVAYVRDGAAPREIGCVPESGIASLELGDAGYQVTTGSGKTFLVREGLFVAPDSGDNASKTSRPTEGFSLKKDSNGLALVVEGRSRPLFVVGPSQPWPGSMGFGEVVHVDGAFHPIRKGWPDPAVSVEPSDIPGASELTSHSGVWRVPLAGWNEVVVARGDKGWNELTSSHPLSSAIPASGLPTGPHLLTLNDLASLSQAQIRYDDEGPWFQTRGGIGLGWTSEGWARRKVNPLETAYRQPIAEGGALPSDRWKSVTVCDEGVLIHTDGGDFVASVDGFTTDGTAELVKVAGSTPVARPLEPRAALVKATVGAQQDGALTVQFTSESRRHFLGLKTGLLGSESIAALGFDRNDPSALRMRMADGSVCACTDERLQVADTAMTSENYPIEFQLSGNFSLKGDQLEWRPAESKNAVLLGNVSQTSQWRSDDVVDFFPAPGQGIYQLSSAGLWLWRENERVAVVSEESGSIVQGEKFALRKDRGEARHLLVHSARTYHGLQNEKSTRLGAPLPEICSHPLTGEGQIESAKVSWTATDDRSVTFRLAIDDVGRSSSIPIKYCTTAFEHQLPTALNVRGNEVRLVRNTPGFIIEYALDSKSKSIDGPIVRGGGYVAPRPPDVFGGDEGTVRFRKNRNGYYQPEVAFVRDEGEGQKAWTSSDRGSNGQFQHDVVRLAATADGLLFTATERGIVRSKTDLTEMGLLPSCPLGVDLDQILTRNNVLFVRNGSSVSSWDGTRWNSEPPATSPYAPHHLKACVIKDGCWQVATATTDSELLMDFRFGDGIFRSAPFDGKRGAFHHDVSDGTTAEDCTRHGKGTIQWETAFGWFHANLPAKGAIQGKILSEEAAPKPGPVMQTADGWLEIKRAGGRDALTVHANRPGTSSSIKNLTSSWRISAGRLPHDRIRSIAAVPGEETYVLATDGGLRELNYSETGLEMTLHALGSDVLTSVNNLHACNLGNVVAKDSGNRAFNRKCVQDRVTWEKCDDSIFNFVTNYKRSHAGSTSDEALRWEYRDKSSTLSFKIYPPDQEALDVTLDRLGFNLDRPEVVFYSDALWLCDEKTLFRIADPSRGIRSILRAGHAPEAVVQRTTPDFEPCLTICRGGENVCLDLTSMEWTKRIKLHPNAWSAFLHSGLLVDSDGPGEAVVDWTPSGNEEDSSAQIRLQMENGHFLHDLSRSAIRSANGDNNSLLLGTTQGVVVRRLPDYALTDLRFPTDGRGRTIDAFLRTNKGIVAWRDEQALAFDIASQPVFGAAAEFEVLPDHSGPYLTIGRSGDRKTVLQFKERLTEGFYIDNALVASDRGIRDGHLPGDVVEAAFVEGGVVHMLTDAGLVSAISKKESAFEPILGFRRPEGHSGRLANRVSPPYAPNGVVWDSVWYDSKTLWIAFENRAEPIIIRTDGRSTWDVSSTTGWATARSKIWKRPRWEWIHEGPGYDLALFGLGIRGGETDFDPVTAFCGALETDYCNKLGVAGVKILSSCPKGVHDRGHSVKKPDLILQPKGVDLLEKPPLLRETTGGDPCLVAENGWSALVLDKSGRDLVLEKRRRILAAMRRTEYADPKWLIYRDIKKKLHLVRRDIDLHLVGDRIFADGQFSFDRVIYVVGEADRSIVVTHTCLEELAPSGELSHVLNLPDAPTAVGLNTGLTTLTVKDDRLIRIDETLKPFQGEVCRPRDKHSFEFEGYTVSFDKGLLSLNGSSVALPTECPSGAFRAAGRLWLLGENTVRWVRLDERWLRRMEREVSSNR